MSERQRELDNLLLLMRGIVSIMPLVALARQLENLNSEQMDELKHSGELEKVVIAVVGYMKATDNILEPLDIMNWGQPMGLTNIMSKVK